MLNTQKQYLNYLNSIGSQLTNTHLSADIINNFSTENLSTNIKDVELLIPIIGAFSAGKSTLLNSFLGKDLL